jgi:hypothetical protein
MKFKVPIICLTLAMFFYPLSLQAKGLTEATTITVQGTSQAEVAPDIAYIQLAVVTSAATVVQAQEENARITSQVMKRLEVAGIGNDYIKTVQFSVFPLYQPEDGKQTNMPIIRGYQVTNGFTVTVTPARAGEIIDLALQAGVNAVQSVRFGKDDEVASKNAVLQSAVRDALTKAETIAAVMGKRVSRIQSVIESGVYIQNPEIGGRYNLKMADASSTPVSPGLVHLNANVQVVAEFE